MAASSLRHFIDPSFAPASLQAGARFANDLSIENIRRWFALYTVVQNLTPLNGSAAADARAPSLAGATPVEVLDTLLANLSTPAANDRYWLRIAKSPEVRGGGWHSVVPYAITRPSTDEYLVYVYDPNVPNQNNQVIQINRSTNRWSYVLAKAPDRTLHDYYGDSTSGNLRLVSWQRQTTFPKRCDTICAGQARAESADDVIEFYLDGEGYFLVTRSDGLNAGFHLVNGSPILEIPGAEILPTVSGFGLNIPPGIRIPHTPGATYSVVVASRDTAYGNTESTAHLNILGPDYLVQVSDLKLSMPVVQVRAGGPLLPASAEQMDAPFDSLAVGLRPDTNYLSVKSSLRSQEMPSMGLSLQTQGADYRMTLGGVQIATGYAVALGFDEATGKLAIEDNDPATNSYSISVERLNPNGVTDSATITTDDGQVAGSVLNLGSAWNGGQTPPIRPNTTPTLPRNLPLYLPFVVASPPPKTELLFVPFISGQQGYLLNKPGRD